MGKNKWVAIPEARQLAGYLGYFKIPIRKLSLPQLLETAKRELGLPDSIVSVSEAVDELKSRKSKGKNFKSTSHKFYRSWEWKQLRYQTIKTRGAICECCGATKNDGPIVVDHIKPIRHYWHLRLEESNVQVLCRDCNMGKSYDDTTDWRGKRNDYSIHLIEQQLKVRD